MPIKLEHRLGVAAPADVVWEIIADLPRWGDWSSIYSRAAGTIAFSAVLDIDLVLPGQPPRTIAPKVISWTPNELLHWRTTSPRGWVVATRYLEIDTLSEAGCIFSNGEIIAGLGSAFVPRSMLIAARQGFVAMGEAMKTRAEAVWRARSGEGEA